MKKFPVTPNALFGKITAAAFLIAALAASSVAVRAQKAPTRQKAQTAHAEQSRAEVDTKSVEETPAVKEDAGFGNYAPEAVSAAGYPFTFLTGVALEDMSTGTTQLVAANSDDGVSGLTNFGFDFWFDGVRYTQFSASANGFIRLGTAATTDSTAYTNSLASVNQTPKIAAYWDDLYTGTNGKVHFKVVGSAPNRKLVVEFLNEQIPRVGASTAGAGTFQLWLFESAATTNPGVIQFVYGSGITANTPNTGYSVGIQSGAATNFASVTTSTNTVAYGTANDTQTNAIAAGTSYLFTPNIPTAPTNLTFTATNAVSTTLNFADNASNELGYVIYRSTDGTNFTFLAQTAANATTYTDSGLNPSTQYFYRVYAVTEGALSNPALSGSTTTTAVGNDTCAGAGGNYSNPATWADGTVPTAGDNVTIQSGCAITVDTTGATALNLTIDSGGTVTGAAGTTLNVGGNLTNNGTLDLSPTNTATGTALVFTGANSNTFGGAGATTDVLTINVNKGTSSANVLELTATNFTVQGVATDAAGFLTLTNGTFKLSGTFAVTNRVFTTAGFTIGATTGFWLNNPNFTVAGQAGSSTVSGLFRVTQGTFNIGTGTGNSMGFNAGANVVVEGGAINAAGRFGVAAAANIFTYTQTAGTITVQTVGNAAATAGFDLGTSASSTVTISGGTIVVQLPSTATTPIDYRNQAGSGIAGVTGGTLQLGNANSGAARAFNIRGVVPNLVITNTSGAHTATFGTVATYNNITLNITINTGNTLTLGNQTFLFAGAVLTNNGTLVHTGTSARFITFSSTVAQSYTGSGTVTTPMNSFEFQSDLGFTFDPSVTPIVTLRVINFVGNVINSNKLIVGNGGTTSAIIQIGNTTTPTAAGTFDQQVGFNPGTGGVIISYLRTAASRTTGGEIPTTRSITNLTYDDNDTTHTLTIAGGDLTVTGALTLTNGIVLTGTNTLVHNGAAARTNGFVAGNLSRNYTATGAYTYFVGDNAGTPEFSPMTANITALATNPSSLRVSVSDATLPGLNPAQAASRFWTLTEGGDLTADLTFQYLAGDVNGTESAYQVYKREAGATTLQGGVVNATAHTATVAGVSNFSDWGVGAQLAPTAGEVSISGRAMTATGRGIRNVTITLTDASGNTRTTRTTALGRYQFRDVAAGETYVITAKGKRYAFTQPSQVVNINEDAGDINFTGMP